MKKLETLTPLEFRQKLAGLIDNGKEILEIDQTNIKNESIRFTSILAKLFGQELDRLTLWDRIGTALISSSSKHPEDVESFVNACLVHIKASSSQVASSDELDSIIQNLVTKNNEWKKQFINYISKNHFIILVYAKKRWNEYKEKKIEL